MPHSDEDQVLDRLLGDLEEAVMRLMWAREKATVRQIHVLLQESGRQLAYTTVMTVMSRLAMKGLLARDLIGKTHTYRATTSREGFLRAASARQVEALVEDFGDIAVAQFLAEVTRLSPERRRQLEQLVADESDQPDN
jgi:predicted transcriptional regulator